MSLYYLSPSPQYSAKFVAIADPMQLSTV